MNSSTKKDNIWALVTGASSGMGVFYAKDLAMRGYNVLLVSNQQQQVEDVAKDICKLYNVNAVGLYKDLSLVESAQELFDYCNNNCYQVEILINNAGIFFFTDVINCPMAKIQTMINLHVLTSTKLCRLFAEQMKNRNKGYILNMSSISAHTPFSGISLYTATKSYIRTFSKALHYELKEYGVKVLTVSPGGVATDLYNLPRNLQKLGVNLGVIYKPDKLTHRAIDKLLKGKIEYVPGIINRLFKPIFAMLPGFFKMWMRKKLKRFMNEY